MLRCSGEVVRTNVKSGTSAKSGNAYRIREARVLVGRADFVDLSLGDDHPDLRDGDLIDVAVRFSGTFNGQPQFRVVGRWSDVVPELAHDLTSV